MAAVEGEALDEREPCEELSMVISWWVVRLIGLVEPRPDLEATRCVSAASSTSSSSSSSSSTSSMGSSSSSSSSSWCSSLFTGFPSSCVTSADSFFATVSSFTLDVSSLSALSRRFFGSDDFASESFVAVVVVVVAVVAPLDVAFDDDALSIFGSGVICRFGDLTELALELKSRGSS
ncbi:hypothetical protein PUN28_004894 [Cardiocondyla obscurior]|uniref:Uncharacterized protein n=1 Tax=Cardiocondyla obscurior TaxID=286306 RepID=A0AAW2GCZ5_9HYME